MMHSATYHMLLPCLSSSAPQIMSHQLSPHLFPVEVHASLSSVSIVLFTLNFSVFMTLPIFYLVACVSMLSCVSSLYILDSNPLLYILFADIFFHLIGCLFILLMVSFTVQKLFDFM